jgi:hypothetical protein
MPPRAALTRLLLPLLLALGLTPSLLAQGVDIARMAPAKTDFIAAIPDFARFRAGFERSELGRLWEEPSVRAWVEKTLEEDLKGFAELLRAVNVDAKDLKPPVGYVGVAGFSIPRELSPDPVPSWRRGPVADKHFLAAAELGDNAASWDDVLDRLLEHGVKEKQITTEEDDHAGARLHIVKPIYPEGEDEEEDGGGGLFGLGSLARLFGGSHDEPRTLIIARQGTAIVASTHRPTLELALDALSGHHIDCLEDVPAFRQAEALRSEGELAWGVLLLEGLMKELTSAGAGQTLFAFGPFLDSFGVTKLRALTVGLKLDTPDAIAELSTGVLVPEKKGLLALFDAPAAGFSPPDFAPADAGDLTRFGFNFAGLWDVAREFVGGLPGESRGQAQAMLDQAQNIAKPALEALGPGVSYMTLYKQPLDAKSESSLFAIDLRDQVTVVNTITFLAGQMQGMFEARDFEGNTIYSPTDDDGPSFGIGFNKLFIGNGTVVENAMRMAGHPDQTSRLADEPRFRDAARLLSPDATVFSFTDTERTIRWLYWSEENELKVLEAEIEEWGLDEQEKEDYLKDERERIAKKPPLPPIETLLSHLGDVASDLRSTPEGFRGRALMLRPGRR